MAKPRPKQPKVGIESVQRNNTTPILFGVGGLVVILLIVAIVIAANGKSKKSNETDAVEFQPISTTAGTALPAEYPDQKSSTVAEDTGTPAPSISGKDFQGNPVNITADGHPKVVMFFAHWCPHCQREVPLLSPWLKANMKKYPNVEFYAVATGSDPTKPNYPPSAWLSKEKWPTPVIADDNNGDAATAFGLGAFPYLVAIDSNNNLVTRNSGELSMTDFENTIVKAADTGKPQGKAAAASGSATQVTTTTGG